LRKNGLANPYNLNNIASKSGLMNTKTIPGISLGAVFVVSMMMMPAFAGGHVILEEVKVNTNGKQLEIEVAGPIPQDGSLGAFGFGAFGTKAILAITTHGGVGPDSEAQTNQADPVFHTHALQLKTVSAATCGSETAVASASFNEVGDLEVTEDTVEVKNISKSEIGKLTGTVVSFLLSVSGEDICVNVIRTLDSE